MLLIGVSLPTRVKSLRRCCRLRQGGRERQGGKRKAGHTGSDYAAGSGLIQLAQKLHLALVMLEQPQANKSNTGLNASSFTLRSPISMFCAVVAPSAFSKVTV